MSGPSKIEWLNGGCTWNPIIGCSHAHTGCTHCYAERMATRLAGNPKTPQYKGIATGGKWTGKVRLVESELLKPLHWRKPRRIFVCSMSDLFHPDVRDEWRDKVHAVMALSPRHDYILLTKRMANARRYYLESRSQSARFWGDACPAGWSLNWTPPIGGGSIPLVRSPRLNLTLGYSASDQPTLEAGIGDLLETPAARRILSLEPLVGPVDLMRWFITGDGHDEPHRRHPGIDGIIVGGETGPGARPMHPDWVRSIRDQCADAGVPFFLKRMSSGSRELDGRTHEEWCR